MVVPRVGEVVMAKRRGSRNLRITITAAGQIRVAMPQWTPYAAGIIFVQKHEGWIRQQLKSHSPSYITDGALVGRHHRVSIKSRPHAAKTTIRVSRDKISANTFLPVENTEMQEQLIKAAERALKQEAEIILPKRLKLLSNQHGISYGSLRIRKMTSRWGSCSSKKNISLSYYLVQLPDELVDYVLLHELAHTIHHNHGKQFWAFMDEKLPDAKRLKKDIKTHRPRVEPSTKA